MKPKDNSTDLDCDAQNIPYVMPDEVRNQLVNAVIVAPVCCDLLEKVSNQDVDFKTRMLSVEAKLNDFVQKLECEHFYDSIIDFLIWTQTLDPILHPKKIDKTHINWMNK
jgi:hypothetical protein